MPIPAFTRSGALPKGLHKCHPDEFYDRYCVSPVNRSAIEEKKVKL